MNTNKTATSRNRLTYSEYYKLTEYIKENFHSKNWSGISEVMRDSEYDIQLKVSYTAVKDAINTLNLKFPKPNFNSPRGDRVGIVAAELANLLRELGKEPSENLKNVIQKKKT